MRWVLRNENFPRAVILVTLVIAFGMVTHGVTYHPRGLVNILLQGSIVEITGMGQTFVMLTGGIDVSLFGVGVLASIVGATIVTRARKSALSATIQHRSRSGLLRSSSSGLQWVR